MGRGCHGLNGFNDFGSTDFSRGISGTEACSAGDSAVGGMKRGLKGGFLAGGGSAGRDGFGGLGAGFGSANSGDDSSGARCLAPHRTQETSLPANASSIRSF
jgi:hypothetical protein